MGVSPWRKIVFFNSKNQGFGLENAVFEENLRFPKFLRTSFWARPFRKSWGGGGVSGLGFRADGVRLMVLLKRAIFCNDPLEQPRAPTPRFALIRRPPAAHPPPIRRLSTAHLPPIHRSPADALLPFARRARPRYRLCDPDEMRFILCQKSR